MSAFEATKLWLVTHTGLAKDALHLYVAMGLFFGSCALLGWRVGGWKPVVLVLAAAIGGEAWDMANRAGEGVAQDYRGNWHDIWNMMVWPVAVTLLARCGRLPVVERVAASGDGGEETLE